MQNIMSKQERIAVKQIEKNGVEPHTTAFGETKRVWFDGEVYDGDCRLKCVATDFYCDYSGEFVNTVWEDKDGMEYDCLMRDLEECIQERIVVALL